MALNFLCKNRRTYSGTNDVMITIVKNPSAETGFSTAITFHNDCYKKITKTEHICIAIEGDRLYFAEAGSEGWKCAVTGNSKRASIVNKSLYEWATLHRGEYELLYDSKEECYYIGGLNEGGES